MPDGGTITVCTYNTMLTEEEISAGLTPAEYVVIEVVDSGVGISPENLQRISIHFTTKEVGKGTGPASAWCTLRAGRERQPSKSRATSARAARSACYCLAPQSY
jgi:hypothetical protein